MTMSDTLSQAHIMALDHGFMDARVLLTEGRPRRVFGRRPRRVCVIGAGISGLVTAKVLLEDGFDPLVFEKDAALGGVWSPSRTYPGLCANNTRDTYAFSDHPYPPTAGMFPSAEQVRDYLGSYADRFGCARACGSAARSCAWHGQRARRAALWSPCTRTMGSS